MFWDFDRAVSVNKPKDLDCDFCGICGDGDGDASNDLVIGDVSAASSKCTGASAALSGLNTGDIMGPGVCLFSFIKDKNKL